MEFRLKYYDDIYNVELKKRFYSCYRLDLIENGESVISLITSRNQGVLYDNNEAILSFGGRWFSKFNLFLLDGIEVGKSKLLNAGFFDCNSYVVLKNDKKYVLGLNEGLFKKNISFKYFVDNQLVCEFSGNKSRKSIFEHYVYEGKVLHDNDLDKREIILLLLHANFQLLADRSVD